MSIAGVICELNPFHNGHEYLFMEAKKKTGAKYIVAVMSGDFVQRGLPAICDKYTRTKMALLGGADLVIELPTLYSTASADYFALGGVSALDNLRCVDFLCFGSECGSIEYLNKYVKNNFANDREAHILSQNNSCNNNYSAKMTEYIRNGNSYNKAHALASGQSLSSNDMLAACYIKSLYILDSMMEPVAITRKGSAYLDASAESDSASAIRNLIFNGAGYESKIPDYVRKCLDEVNYEYFPIEPDDFSVQLFTRIDSIIKNENRDIDSLSEYMDVSENIKGRIRSNIADYISYSEFLSEVHSKEYTKSRVMRALLHILLDIRKSDYSNSFADNLTPYVRILGFREESKEILGIIKENCLVPVISKARDAKRLLDDEAYRIFEADVNAANIYEQACSFKFHNEPVHDFSKEIVII